MTTNGTQTQNTTASLASQSDAAKGLALVRVTVGAMFVWVFFENLGKGLYKPSGYAALINDYIENGSAPAAWKRPAMAARRGGRSSPRGSARPSALPPESGGPHFRERVGTLLGIALLFPPLPRGSS